MQRLNKFIASSGLCSRRSADDLIESGKVSVNGKIVTELGFQVGSKDKVSVSGKIIKPQKLDYYRFYKPAGYITTSDDEKAKLDGVVYKINHELREHCRRQLNMTRQQVLNPKRGTQEQTHEQQNRRRSEM